MSYDIESLAREIPELRARVAALEAKHMVFGPLPPDERTAIERGNELARIIKETMEKTDP